MRVPYEWLREFVDIKASPQEVAKRLTMVGFEVESTESVSDDVTFEVNVTPNRPDCLSIVGIAREVSAAFDIPLKIPNTEIKEVLPLSDFSVEVLNPELCNRYTGMLIKGVTVSDSPEWIKSRLKKCGIRVINNVVDITNYVLLEFGHPLHAFDADTLSGKKVVVATVDAFKKRQRTSQPLPSLLKEGVEVNTEDRVIIKTLDGVERQIPMESLLIWDDEKPIAIAGIMGSSETEVSDKTKNVFLESAYFEPTSVRRTSKRLNLTSESSYRFERGTDIEFLENALRRAALMIREIAGGTIHQIIDVYPVKYVPEPIEVRYERINRILGTDLSNTEILEIMNRLSIKTEDKGDTFIVYPPTFRRDIRNSSDIAEEIARSYGYERIPTTMPRSPLSSVRFNKRTMNINRIKEAMRKSGFVEAINYSFMSLSDLDMIAIPEDDKRRNTVAIKNPLSQKESLLRTTLTPALIENLKHNLYRGIKDIRIFEISRVFNNIGKPLPLEELRLAGVLYKGKPPSLWKEDAQGFFIAKGAIESIFEDLKIKVYSFLPSAEPFLHRGSGADIYASDSYIGYIGRCSPEIVERIGLKKQNEEIVVFELNVDTLLTLIPDSISYTPIPKYPYVERDVAIMVDEHLKVSTIKEIITGFPSEFIEEVSVFDLYKGGNIPVGKKSIAFNIRYRSKDRTLRDDEVENLHTALLKHLLDMTGGELRK